MPLSSATMMSKPCITCKISKSLTQFHHNKNNNDGVSLVCKGCHNANLRERYATDKEYRLRKTSQSEQNRDPVKTKNWDLQRKYGITIDDYQDMLTAQDSVCLVCQHGGNDRTYLVVDHNHKTGKVRGLLCPNCNRGLGQFGDSSDLLRRAARYLESHE